MKEKPGSSILMLVDNNGQRMSLQDELLGLSQYIAHLVNIQDQARRMGHKIISLVYGNSIAGGFIAFGMGAPSRIYAMSDAHAKRGQTRFVHLKDLKNNVSLYSSLGVSTYLAIDAVTPTGQPHEPIELHLWRLIGERPRAQQADRDGYFILPANGTENDRGRSADSIDKPSDR